MPHFDLSPTVQLIVVCIATLFSGTVNSATGVGGAGILMVVLLAVLPKEEALVIVALSQISRNLSLTAVIGREANIPVFKRLALGGFVGAILGAFLVGVVSELFFRKALGVGLLVFIGMECWKPHGDWHVPGDTLPAVGFLTGTFSALTGTTGPIAAPFLFRHGLTGVPLVATVTMAALVMNTAKLGVYGFLGFFHQVPPALAWGTVISVVIGVQIGVTVLKKLSHGRFRLVFLGMLFFVAIGYLFGGVKENPAAEEVRLKHRMQEQFQIQHE